jgi:hypothetical protein
MKNTNFGLNSVDSKTFRSSEGDILTLHLGAFPSVALKVADQPLEFHIRSGACVALVKIALMLNSKFELGGFWLAERECHTPIILLEAEMLSATFAYSLPFLTERLHSEFFVQFPTVDLLVQDRSVFRPRSRRTAFPRSIIEEVNAAIGSDARSFPSAVEIVPIESRL